MDEEELGSQRAEWSRTVRASMMKKLFPNAPKRSRCRLCKTTYPNSVYTGSGIVTSMCNDCVKKYVGDLKPRKRKGNKKPVEIKPLEIKQEDLLTLKEYLEMKI